MPERFPAGSVHESGNRAPKRTIFTYAYPPMTKVVRG